MNKRARARAPRAFARRQLERLTISLLLSYVVGCAKLLSDWTKRREKRRLNLQKYAMLKSEEAILISPNQTPKPTRLSFCVILSTPRRQTLLMYNPSTHLPTHPRIPHLHKLLPGCQPTGRPLRDCCPKSQGKN